MIGAATAEYRARARKVQQARGAYAGTTLGGDLSRRFPSELANLGIGRHAKRVRR